MRIQIVSLVVLFMLAIGFSACSNGPYSAGDPQYSGSTPNPLYVPPGASSTPTGTCVCIDPMSANIDGATWKSDTNAFYMVMNTIPMIMGVDTANKYQVSLYLYGYTGPGTYYYGSGITNQALVLDGTTIYSTAVGGGSGVLVISSDINNKIQGKFSFTAYTTDGKKSHTVTGGWVNVPKK